MKAFGGRLILFASSETSLSFFGRPPRRSLLGDSPLGARIVVVVIVVFSSDTMGWNQDKIT
jgi:hypothetical protein